MVNLPLSEFELETLEQHLLDYIYKTWTNEPTAEEYNALIDILFRIENGLEATNNEQNRTKP